MADNSLSNQLSKDDIENLRSLKPGTVVDLQIATPTAPKRVRVAYVGMDIPNCLVFQVPASAKWMTIRDLLFVENDLVVRYVLEGTVGQVIAFRSTVLKLLSKPSGLLITSFPERVESIGLRSSKRAQPGIAVSVSSEIAGPGAKTTGIVVDISNKGCRLAMPVNPDWPVLDEGVVLTLSFRVGDTENSLKAIVKNQHPEEDFVYYGLQFDSDEKVVSDVLAKHTLIT